MKAIHKAISMIFLILGLMTLSSVGAGWSSPMVLNKIDARNLKIRLDSLGNAIAIWETFDGKDSHNVQTARLSKGGSWTEPTTLSSYAGGVEVSASPVLAVSPAGHAVAIWQEWTGNQFILKSSISDGGDWTFPVSISDPSQSNYWQRMEMDQFGNAIAIWKKHNVSSVIQSAVLPFRGTWSTPATLSDPKLKAIEPQIAVNYSGNAIAIWMIEGPDYLIESSTRLTNGQWSSPLILRSGSNRAALPKIVLDSMENAAAVWIEFVGNVSPGVEINSARLPFKGVWSKPSPITPPVDSVSIDFPFILDGKGNGILLWVSSPKNSASHVQAAAYHNEGSWSKPVVISSLPKEVQDGTVALAVSPSGRAVATWHWNYEDRIHASMLLPDGSWSPPATLPGKDSELQDVAMDPRGYAVVCWTADGIQGKVTLYAVWTPSTE